jgi:hypothetical protein
MNIFKKFFKQITLHLIIFISDPFGFLEFKFLKWETDKNLTTILSELILKKAEEVAKKEHIPVYYISTEELNLKFEKDNLACGTYYFLKSGGTRIGICKDDFFPRIEIDKNTYTLWSTFLHELGHHFSIIRKDDYTEESANQYIEEFFDLYLPPFFKWCLQISVHTFAHTPRIEYSREENYKYWKESREFLKSQKKLLSLYNEKA